MQRGLILVVLACISFGAGITAGYYYDKDITKDLATVNNLAKIPSAPLSFAKEAVIKEVRPLTRTIVVDIQDPYNEHSQRTYTIAYDSTTVFNDENSYAIRPDALRAGMNVFVYLKRTSGPLQATLISKFNSL